MASSIREALESAVSAEEAKQSAITEAQPAAEEPVAEQVQPAATEVPIGAEPAAAEAQKPERKREEDGKFAKETPRERAIRLGHIKPAAAKPATPAAPAAAAQQQPAEPAAPKVPMPKSWAKEKQADWDAMTPSQQAYIKERDDHYFKGVSTYKQEWENAKPLLDAVAPFLPTLQQAGIRPDVWITNLGRAHYTLATGSGQSKLQMFAKLAQDYGVPLQALYDQNAAQQFVQSSLQQPAPRQAQAPQDLEAVVQRKLDERDAQAKFAEFQRDIETKYPHYETVRDDMALLIQAGKAKDYPSAYAMAVRLHDDLFAAEQEAKTKAAEAARQEQARAAVAAAKGNAVSVKSATPAGGAAKTPTTRREALEAAYDAHASGRV